MAKCELGARKRKRQAVPAIQITSAELKSYMDERDPGTEYTLLACSPQTMLKQMQTVFESNFPHLRLKVEISRESTLSEESESAETKE